MFHKTRSIARQYGAKVVAGAVGSLAFMSAHAAGIDDLFDAVDLSGIGVKVLAAGSIIVLIALYIKGPAIVKRIVAKI